MNNTTPLPAGCSPHHVLWDEPGHRWLPRVAGGADEGESTDSGDEEHSDTGADAETNAGAGEAKLTQAEVDELVKKRLGQARKTWEREAADAAEKAAMSETERLKAEKADAEKAAAERASAADQRVVRAEAKVAAVAAGVKPERAAAFMRIVDLASIELDDNGDPDAAALSAAITAALKEFPEFKGVAATGGASGSEHGGDPKAKPKNLAEAVAARLAS